MRLKQWSCIWMLPLWWKKESLEHIFYSKCLFLKCLYGNGCSHYFHDDFSFVSFVLYSGKIRVSTVKIDCIIVAFFCRLFPIESIVSNMNTGTDCSGFVYISTTTRYHRSHSWKSKRLSAFCVCTKFLYILSLFFFSFLLSSKQTEKNGFDRSEVNTHVALLRLPNH